MRAPVIGLLLLSLVGTLARAEGSFANPLGAPVADPFVLQLEDQYYLYGTWEPNTAAGVPVFTSSDLAHWQWQGFVFQPSSKTWAQTHFWGPEVIEWEGRYLLVCAASPKRDGALPLRMGIVVAESDSPLGPFSEVSAPLLAPEPPDEAIDGHIFHDEDGSLWLYFTLVTQGRNEIQVAPLAPDLLSLAGESVLCTRPEQPWESHPWLDHVVNEGAFVTKHAGAYYLIYTANHYLDPNYCLGYATAPTPTGPWTKPEGNPVLARSEEVAGPGSGSLLTSPDGTELWLIYHTHNSLAQVAPRQLAMDRVHFEPATSGPDRLVVEGPTRSPRPLPGGAPEWPEVASDEFVGAALDRSRWFLLNERPEAFWVAEGSLWIRPTNGDMWTNRDDFGNLFLQEAPPPWCEATARVRFGPQMNYEQAYVLFYQDHDNWVRLSTLWADGPCLAFGWEIDGEYQQVIVPNELGRALLLKMTRKENSYKAFASSDGNEWEQIGETVTVPLVCPKVGLGALATTDASSPSLAQFESFHLSLLP